MEAVNGTVTWVMAPDGSKEGRAYSLKMDDFRTRFIASNRDVPVRSALAIWRGRPRNDPAPDHGRERAGHVGTGRSVTSDQDEALWSACERVLDAL